MKFWLAGIAVSLLVTVPVCAGLHSVWAELTALGRILVSAAGLLALGGAAAIGGLCLLYQYRNLVRDAGYEIRDHRLLRLFARGKVMYTIDLTQVAQAAIGQGRDPDSLRVKLVTETGQTRVIPTLERMSAFVQELSSQIPVEPVVENRKIPLLDPGRLCVRIVIIAFLIAACIVFVRGLF